MVLRTVVECLITLSYLEVKNEDKYWKEYRVFGAGQAKLSSLKLDDSEEQPSYVNYEALKSIANEDMWEEFLPIDVGHWQESNLRKMSEVAGVKDIYDRFYGWTSSFTHGHWGAIRDSVFDTCGNPLHRLHRVPRKSCNTLPDVIPDVLELVDRILTIVSNIYPDFNETVLDDNPNKKS